MLSALHIRDFAIVEQLDQEFQSGMTVLTGETGAGKSIIIDALGIALGDRADSGTVRHGSKRAEIMVEFDIRANKRAQRWLEQHELDSEDDCILRRIVNADSGSRAFINGRPVPLPQLRELSELLIDIHSQHAHQSLLRNDEQRRLLDNYGGHEQALRAVRELYTEYRATHDKLARLLDAQKDRVQRQEFLSFQLEELVELAPQQNEWNELDQEHHKLANSENIQRTISGSLDVLYDDKNAVLNRIHFASRELSGVSKFDGQISDIIELLESASIQVEEAVSSLRHLADDSEIDPQRLQWLEQRIARYVALSRKHHCEPPALFEVTEALQMELNTLQHSDDLIKQTENQLNDLRGQYAVAADKLGAQRQQTAKKLNKEITTLLRRVGMAESRFEATLQSIDSSEPGPNGLETVAFQISANPGQPLQPLAKVASGGELSRVSLAIQVATARVSDMPTLIFDEVDVGIGGGVAEIVGDLLRTLGSRRQILCITHQPQVASQGHQHLRVRKSSNKKSTTTILETLTPAERVLEVARMLGGVEITDTTRAHALEMLNRAQEQAITA